MRRAARYALVVGAVWIATVAWRLEWEQLTHWRRALGVVVPAAIVGAVFEWQIDEDAEGEEAE